MTRMWLCKDCSVEKPLNTEHFYIDKHQSSGFMVYCRDCRNKRSRAYFQTEKGKAVQRLSNHSAGIRYPEKRKARLALRYAVLCGKIIRPTECPECGGVGRIEGHHHDYAKPLEVVWLCNPCHNALHRQLRSLKVAAPTLTQEQKK